jgi:hypothetical protein
MCGGAHPSLGVVTVERVEAHLAVAPAIPRDDPWRGEPLSIPSRIA